MCYEENNDNCNRRLMEWSESAFYWAISEGLSEIVMSEMNDIDSQRVRRNHWGDVGEEYVHERDQVESLLVRRELDTRETWRKCGWCSVSEVIMAPGEGREWLVRVVFALVSLKLSQKNKYSFSIIHKTHYNSWICFISTLIGD